MDSVFTLIVRVFIFIFSLLPEFIRIKIFYYLIKLIVFFNKKHYKISLKNISIAFPNKSLDWQKDLFDKSCHSIALLISDFIKISRVDSSYLKNNIRIENYSKIMEIKKNSNTGILYVSGHLGSFELMLFSYPYLVNALYYIARDLKSKKLNEWLKNYRNRSGNKEISRKGGVKTFTKLLLKKKDVGILFDQNVTRNQAIFVPWFSRKAATTKAVAGAILLTKAPVVMTQMLLEDKKYIIKTKIFDFNEIIDSKLEKNKKLYQITEILVKNFEKMIERDPQSWFWMHRRWRTTENENEKNIYS